MNLKTLISESLIPFQEKMTPADFEQLTGVQWTTILDILVSYKKTNTMAASIETKAAINTEYNYRISDEAMLGLIREINSINNLSGHIFEILCTIYFGMKYGEAKLDSTMNPEYDILTKNKCVQCKWSLSKNNRVINFKSVNKKYGFYKPQYEFCIMSGHIGKVELINNVNRNVLQLAANLINMFNKSGYSNIVDYIQSLKENNKNIIINNTKKTLTPTYYKQSDKRTESNELNYGINGKIDTSIFIRNKKDVFGNETGDKKSYIFPKNKNSFSIDIELLKKYASSIEKVDISKAVKKFVIYFKSRNLIKTEFKSSDKIRNTINKTVLNMKLK